MPAWNPWDWDIINVMYIFEIYGNGRVIINVYFVLESGCAS